MIPVIAIPNVQIPPPVQTSVVTAAETNIAIGSLPLTFVAPTVSVPEAQNQTRGSSSQTGRSLFAPPVPSLIYPSEPPAQERSPASLPLGFTSPFVTQALAQSGESEGQKLMAFFSADTTPPIKSESGGSVVFRLLPFEPSLAALPREIAATVHAAHGELPTPRSEGTLKPPSQRKTTSLVDGSGTGAYTATLARNAVHLTPAFRPRYEATV